MERLKAAADAERDEIIAVHCQTTFHCLAIHVYGGKPFLTETVGPLNPNQADAWAAGLDDTGEVRIIH